jgi:hypothetical protein
MADCPDTQAAALAGEVSLPQAAEITRTEAEVPGSEGELLALARRSGLGAVRDQARKRRVGVPFLNRLEAETDRCYRQTRKEGQGEPREALAADAFAAIVLGQGRGRAASADLVILCDLAAYRRGHLHPGEVCQLQGGGPIPVALARQLGADAFLKAIIRDGVVVHTVAHFSRHIPASCAPPWLSVRPPSSCGFGLPGHGRNIAQ